MGCKKNETALFAASLKYWQFFDNPGNTSQPRGEGCLLRFNLNIRKLLVIYYIIYLYFNYHMILEGYSTNHDDNDNDDNGASLPKLNGNGSKYW